MAAWKASGFELFELFNKVDFTGCFSKSSQHWNKIWISCSARFHEITLYETMMKRFEMKLAM